MECARGSSTASTSDGINVAESGPSAPPPPPFECRICMDIPADPVATSCGHVFCWRCLYLWLSNLPKPCPVCRSTVRRDINVFPLFGVGRSGHSNDCDCRDAEHETAASNCRCVVPPRPAPPPPSVLSIRAPRRFPESTEQARNWETGLEQYLLRVDRLILEGRERRVEGVDARNALEQRVQQLQYRNNSLLREARERQLRGQQQLVREHHLQQSVRRLQQRLDRANRLLQSQSENNACCHSAIRRAHGCRVCHGR